MRQCIFGLRRTANLLLAREEGQLCIHCLLHDIWASYLRR